MLLSPAELKEFSKENPGALSFLAKLTDSLEHRIIFDFLKKAPTVKGPQLWVLYSDLGGSSLDAVYDLCLNIPIDILADACAREDYSGIRSIEQYRQGLDR